MEMNKRRRIQILYFIFAWGGVISFIVLLLLKGSDAADWLVMEHNYNYQFSDFFRQIVYASDLQNIYFNTDDAPFPPLAYVFFYLIGQLNPIYLPIELSSWKPLQNYQYNLLIFVMFLMTVTILFAEIIKKILCFREIDFLLFVLSVLFSAPFMAGAIERGNLAFVVCILLLWAMYLKDSTKVWKREMALVLIAISAGLKIYPAVFGFIYLREKRWKEVIRLVIYGVAFFFIPFTYTGGITGIKQYINILGNFEKATVYRWTNIRSFTFALLHQHGLSCNTHMGMLVENFYLLVCIITMFQTKEKWKRVLFLSGIMTLYVPNSYRYVSTYMLIPLIFWFQQQSGKWRDSVYCILFSLIFSIPTYAYFIGGECDFYIFAPIYGIMIFSVIETWMLERNNKKND